MKRIILLFAVIVVFTTCVNGQVFHSASTLKKGTFSVGVEPSVFVNGGENFYLFLHGGYGIKKGLDLALKFGVGNDNYFGADLEFAIQRNISLTVGAHSFNNFGLDGALLFNIPIKSDIKLVTGIDADINFAEDVELPIWIPVGLEIYLKKNTVLIFESEIKLTNPAYHFFGGGLAFYL